MLFTKSNNPDGENTELIKFGPVLNLPFDKLSPHLTNAINEYILPATGASTYKVIEDYYNNSSSSSASATTTNLKDQLLETLQRAEFNCGMALFVKIGQYITDGKGVSKAQAPDTVAASYPEVEALAQDYLNRGLKALDEALALLNSNPDTFTTFTSNPLNDLFIQSAAEFSEIYGINKSTRTFTALIPSIKKVQNLYLKRELTSTFMQELLNYINQADSSSASATDNTKIDELINSIKLAVAHLTIAHAPESLTLQVEANALQLIEPIGKTIFDKLSAHRPLIASKKNDAEVDGNAYLNDALLYLQEQASDNQFATFYNSSKYIAPSTDEDDDLPISNHGGVVRL